MIRLDSDQAFRDSLAERAYTYVTQEHTCDRFMARYIEAYETVAHVTTGVAVHAPSQVELTQTSE